MEILKNQEDSEEFIIVLATSLYDIIISFWISAMDSNWAFP